MERVTKVLIVLLIFSVLALPLSMKFFGATEVPKLVEQDGFCKIKYGDTWKFNEQDKICYDRKETGNVQTFTEQQFREVCPKVHLFDLRFYSDCFKKGDSR